MLMADKKDNNVILFPKVPKVRPNQKAQELDAKRQEMIRLEHNKIYVQAISESITEDILMRFRDENFNLTDETFLKDYKMFTESIRSLLLRQVKMKHPLQEKVDKAITTKGKGKDLYAITIDYEKF
jgi:hypothetical protein